MSLFYNWLGGGRSVVNTELDPAELRMPNLIDFNGFRHT